MSQEFYSQLNCGALGKPVDRQFQILKNAEDILSTRPSLEKNYLKIDPSPHWGESKSSPLGRGNWDSKRTGPVG